MRKLWSVSPARLLAALLPVLLTVCLIAAAAAHAQNPPASPTAPSTPAAKPSANDEFLAKAGKLYYSTAKSGLNGFACAAHPDWHTLFLSASKGAAVAADDPRIVLLQTVKITLHGQLKGGSTLDWNTASNPAKPLDQDSTNMLENMHKATNQTLQGFMQFWAPFVDGSVIPANSEGLEIAQTANGHSIHLDASGTSLTEVFDSSLILQQFDVVVTGGTTVNFTPTYKPTQNGLLVSAFKAHIQPAGVPPGQAQEMQVEIEYQTLGGFPIPAKINMDVVNSGTFNFVLDGCTVNP
jgi:hypothetical protein